MSERQRRQAANRQRRLRERRAQELAERKRILAEKRALWLEANRPDLHAAVTSDAFGEAWRYCYGEPPDESLVYQSVDAIEYRLEALADDLAALGVDLESPGGITLGRLGK